MTGRRPLLITGLLFVILTAAAVVLLRPKPELQPEPFFTLHRQVPDTLWIAQGPDTTVVVPQGTTGWSLIRPVVYPADGLAVNALLKRLYPLAVDREFPITPEKLDSFGLRFPQGWIRAAYRDAEPDTLLLGAFTLDNAYVYTRRGSHPVTGLVDAREVRGYLLKRTLEVRDTRVLPFHETSAVEVELFDAAGNRTVRVVREAAGGWRVVEPFPGPADPEKTRDFLRSASHMHVDAFLREGPGDNTPYGLVPPRARLRVVTQAGDSLELSLGDPRPGTEQLYAVTALHPHLLAVSEKYLPVLQWTGDRFRAVRATTFGLSAADSLEIRYGGQRTVEYLSADLPRDLRDVLGNWLSLRSAVFAEATPGHLRRYGLDPPQGELVWWAGEDTLALVRLGRPAGNTLPVWLPAGDRARPTEILFFPYREAGPLWSFLRGRIGNNRRP